MILEAIFSDRLNMVFWWPVAAGLTIYLITAIFSKERKDKQVTFKFVREFVVRHIVEIKEPHIPIPAGSNRRRRKNTSRGDDPLPGAIVVGLILLSIFYAKHQIEVITAFAGFNTFILSFVFLNVGFGISNNIVHDKNWKHYLYTTTCLALIGYPLMYVAVHPIYAPIEIYDLVDPKSNLNVLPLFSKFGGLKGIGFFMFQALGFLTLAMAMVLQVLSLMFYTAAIQLVIAEKRAPIAGFIVKMTSKFRNPYKMMIISLVLYVFSFVLISGVGYELWYGVISTHGS